jgi:hypothetical protein
VKPHFTQKVAQNSTGKPALHERGGAESGAPTLTNSNIAPDLAALIDVWPHLPEPIKAGILALVRAAGG